MAISNLTGAALADQAAAIDARSAQSTMLTSDLLATRTAGNLLPLDATFGAGGLATNPLLGGGGVGLSPTSQALMAPNDTTMFGPELDEDPLEELDDQLDSLAGLGAAGVPGTVPGQPQGLPFLGGLQQNFG